MPTTMTARDAARRMGVKVETLYAYVSRGLIESMPGPEGRTRVFDARAVEALARRGRPRQSSRSTSLNMLIETRLTTLSPQGVRYRGLPSSALAVTHTFEQVAELLWLGELGTGHRPWTGQHFDTGLATGATSLGAALRIAATRLMVSGPPAPGRDAADVAVAGRFMISTLVDSLPQTGDGRATQLVLPSGGAPLRGTIASRLWSRLSPRRPTPALLAVLNAALVLMADHELAASTVGARVAASTWADPYGVVCTALGVLSGPLHGGASRVARAMLDEAVELGPSRAVSSIVQRRERIPGFGHSVYVDVDPRAVVLLDLLRRAVGGSRVLDVVEALQAEIGRRIDQAANVDFALAALTRVGDMPADAGEVVMAVARTAGWLAHAIEEYAEAPLRFRPRASYIGP